MKYEEIEIPKPFAKQKVQRAATEKQTEQAERKFTEKTR